MLSLNSRIDGHAVFFLCCISFLIVTNSVYSQGYKRKKNATYEYLVDTDRFNVDLIDDDPNHYPIVNFAHGFGIAAHPHMPLNITKYFEGYLRFGEVASMNINYAGWTNVWKNEFYNAYADGKYNLDQMNKYSTLEFLGNVRIVSNKKDTDLPVFYKSQPTYNGKEIIYLLVPGQDIKYWELSLGFMNYKDIISEGAAAIDEELIVTTVDGNVLEDIFLNTTSKIYQIGAIYGQEYYAILKKEKRTLSGLLSKRIGFHLLYSPSVEIDDIIHRDGQIYQVELESSGLSFSNLGFRLSYSKNTSIFGALLGAKSTFEIGRYPGINGFPTGILNMYARVSISYSLHFLKRQGSHFRF